tara:strand:- start:147 stop:1082 length:936 start_codon:yes stop_codon:yes gene_type:complete
MIKKILFTSLIILQFQLLSSQNECITVNSSIWDVTWQSCQAKPNPNASRGNTHWILYDLGKIYDLSSTWVWNVNKSSELNSGFKNVIVEYSLDQSNWITLGTYEFEKAPGTSFYKGFKGPDFDKRKARYILLTAIDNWGAASCYGLTEVRFNTTEPDEIPEPNSQIPPTLYALAINTDGNGQAESNSIKTLYLKDESVTLMATGNSGYEFAMWTGDIVSTQNPLNITITKHMQIKAIFTQEALLNCQDEELNPSGNIASSDYVANSTITSSGTVANGSNILFQAGNSIELLNGFHVESGGIFSARIKGCLD